MFAENVDDHGFRALAHADRRAILRTIGAEERAVGDLVDATGLSQPATSQHLRVLRDACLVTVRTDANRRLYAVDFARIGTLRSVLDAFWNERLSALKQVAEGDAS
jgi:DNA-binding transcriptional ArsR family regulator